ncbi:MAG TPA: hypothetical protein VFW65_31840 [Pseudonocardiaceae bacterium]|nr:hypothetical protein [Pseudonocardiaceae bacterium]
MQDTNKITTRFVDGIAVHTIPQTVDDPGKIATGKDIRDGDVIVTSQVVAIRISRMACAVHGDVKVAGFAELDSGAITWTSAFNGRYAQAYRVACDLYGGKRVCRRSAPPPAQSTKDTAPPTPEPTRSGVDPTSAMMSALVRTPKGDDATGAILWAAVDMDQSSEIEAPAPRATSPRRTAQVQPVAPVVFSDQEGAVLEKGCGSD